jgi:DUF1365 family protein
MDSAIYSGVVKHDRLLPRQHKFYYPISMFYVSFQEIEELVNKFWWLSFNKFNFLSFRSKDYLTMDGIRQALVSKGLDYLDENVFILTHVSCLGFCYNPVSFYYCYDQTGKQLQYILAEINNTPWNERHVYVLQCDPDISKYSFEFNKQFHISPFMPMNMRYKWTLNHPDGAINIHMQSYSNDTLQFEAIMALKATEFTASNLRTYSLNYILAPQKVIFRIYWHAFRLWLKNIPFYSHPRKINA